MKPAIVFHPGFDSFRFAMLHVDYQGGSPVVFVRCNHAQEFWLAQECKAQGARIRLLEIARRKCDTAGAHDAGHNAALKKLEAHSSGLGAEEAEARAKQFGLNEIAREKPKSIGARVLETVVNPLVILFSCLSVAELHLARPTAFNQYCGD